MARNPANDITFFSPTPFDFHIVGEGELISFTIEAEEGDLILQGFGNWAQSYIFDGYIGDFNLSISGELLSQLAKRNWIKWSKIAEFDFTLDRSNLAGEAPLSRAGDILHIGKLASTIMVYGTAGVFRLTPQDNVFAKMKMYKVGVMSKGAVLILDPFHLFIDSTGCLWKVEEGMQRLGYEEYLAVRS